MNDEREDGDRQSMMACRDKDKDTVHERDHRERVREVSERVRAENREILNRLATK